MQLTSTMRTRFTLENIANVAMVATALAVLCSIVSATVWRQPSKRAQTVQYTVGERITEVPVDYKSSDRTLLFVLSSRCRFCTASLPFYKDLLVRSEQRQRTRMIAVGNEKASVLSEYLGGAGLAFDTVIALREDVALKTRGTPTLILVDRNGVVRGFWEGLLSAEREKDVLKAISNGPV